jgi:hypothetical protein
MSKKKNYTIAVDFDGTLCEYDFPKIGEQKQHHKDLLDLLIKMRNTGHKLILWTCRGDNEEYPCLSEAITWCKNQGLEFDSINENIVGTKKLSGPSPKVVADFYLDDKSLLFNSTNTEECFNILKDLLK